MSAASRPTSWRASPISATRRSIPIDLHGHARPRSSASIAEVHAAGALPLSAGGDHLITLPIFRAIAKDRPIGMIHFDAHSDTNDRYFGDNKYTHGTPFRRAVEEGLLDPEADGADRHPRLDLQRRRHGVRREASACASIYMEEFSRARRRQAVIAEARRVAGNGPTYVSFDVDGLDPVYAPGTGTPEIGGMTTLRGAAQCCAACRAST